MRRLALLVLAAVVAAPAADAAKHKPKHHHRYRVGQYCVASKEAAYEKAGFTCKDRHLAKK